MEMAFTGFFSKLSQLGSPFKSLTQKLRMTKQSTMASYDPESWKSWKDIYFPCVDDYDTIAVQTLLFSYHLLQELVSGKWVPGEVKNAVAYGDLKFYVTELQLRNHFFKPLHRSLKELHIFCFDDFEFVANKICEMDIDDIRDPQMTWARMVSLYAFSVCLAKKYKVEEDRVEEVSRYVAKYVFKYGLNFIRLNEGWENFSIIDLNFRQ